jgi:ribosomal protein S12 methylthiotransferase
MNIHFISLGCPRNLVDTEIMLGQLLQAGHTIVSEPAEADCVVVNTCGFTRPATDESIDAILEMTGWKEEAQGRRLIVTGCLPQRYGTDLVKSIPEVDVFVGTGAFHRIVDVVGELPPDNPILLPPPVSNPISGENIPRLQTTPRHSAYLKIAEGCSNRCTYCIIPKLRGDHRSRPMEEVVSEARVLAESGAKEVTLVAQNTTAYGHDLHGDCRLEHLLAELAEISQLAWIRVLYGHPDYITDSLLETIDSHDNLLPYFDIPVQHISEPILKKMGRSHKSAKIVQLFDRLRRHVPGAVLRTTLMVGFPGETDADFNRLLDLLERIRFDHMGAFMYSDEKDLPSSRLTGHVDEAVKEERFARLMAKQAAISQTKNATYVGKTLKVLIDGPAQSKGREIIARAVFQAPEIDGIVRIKTGKARPGSFVNARIRGASEYDLTGDLP